MKYKDWQTKENRFLAMTGYTIEQFTSLLPHYKEAHDIYLSQYHMNGKRRKGLRRYVMYANSPLPCVEERLAFILSYLKLNPIQELQADLFGIEQKQCYELVHGLREILHIALEMSNSVPSQTDEELQDILINQSETDKILLHDGTEREIPRPRDEEAQKEKYSGKKKKHTVKNAIIINSLCMVLFVSQTLNGSVHDKTIADSYYTIPRGYSLAQDTGYQGYKPEGVTIIQPTKKPGGKDLTQEQKSENQKISSFRVRVEHAIGSVKRYRIVKDECRLRKNMFVNNIILTCAALHNFRLGINPFHYDLN
jgi:hypothetical protein